MVKPQNLFTRDYCEPQMSWRIFLLWIEKVLLRNEHANPKYQMKKKKRYVQMAIPAWLSVPAEELGLLPPLEDGHF